MLQPPSSGASADRAALAPPSQPAPSPSDPHRAGPHWHQARPRSHRARPRSYWAAPQSHRAGPRSRPAAAPPGTHSVFGAWTRQSGFTLLEALLIIGLLGLGLLGSLGLASQAQQASREARWLQEASASAQNLAEMMRGNPTALALWPTPYAVTLDTQRPSQDAPSCLDPGQSCANPIELAQAQRLAWLVDLGRKLPEMRAQVCPDAQPFDAAGQALWPCTDRPDAPLAIKLGWTPPQSDTAPAAQEPDGPRLVWQLERWPAR